MTKQELIKHYMTKLDCSEAEAIELIEEEENNIVTDEQRELEQKAKTLKRRYEQSDKPRKKAVKERKVDTTKQNLIELIVKAIENNVTITNVQTETEINFTLDEIQYTIKLIKHRPNKKGSPTPTPTSTKVVEALRQYEKNRY